MTKIFRCSFYRSKQPEPPEEEESSAAAWEYVDLEDGKGGGVDSDALPKAGVVWTIALVIYVILAGCVYLGVTYIYHDAVLARGSAFLGAGFIVTAGLFQCGLRPSGSSWWTSTVSQ